MTPVSRLLRPAALLAAAAVGVHELRFAIGFGHADAALARDEHAYLALGVSVAVALLLGACAVFVRSLRQARRAGTVESGPNGGFTRTWLASSAVLSLVYIGQELLEPVFAAGHPGGLTGVLGHAGWAAFLFAVILGALVALLLSGARDAIVRAAAGSRRHGRRRRTEGVSVGARGEIGWSAAPPLALHLAGRAPPLLLR